jgi:hypothetical protein
VYSTTIGSVLPSAEAEFLDEIQAKIFKEFSSYLFTVTSTALPEISLIQPLSYFVQLLYTIKKKGGKPDRKPQPLSYGLRNPYRNLKSENSLYYSQKPQQNSRFVNSASGQTEIITA